VGPLGGSPLLDLSSSDHIFDYVFKDITILYGITDDPMIWAIPRIIYLIDFSRSLWFRERNSFCSHKFIKYPLNIIVIKGVFLFFPFLESRLSTSSLWLPFLLVFPPLVGLELLTKVAIDSPFLIGLLPSSLLGCALL